MPSLGADMVDGRLLGWHVRLGDVVKRGDIVATVDTEKAEIDIETFEPGVVAQLLVEPGTKVPVGAVLAILSADGAAADAPRQEVVEPEAEPLSKPELVTASQPEPVAAHPSKPVAAAEPRSPDGGPRVSPLARRVAADLGVDLTAVRGSGPRGAITRVDVERAAATSPGRVADAASHRSASDRSASLREAVGALMARSKREIPHYHLARDIDLTVALGWLEEHNRDRPPAQRVLAAALLLKAAALSAHDVPEVNGAFQDGTFRPAARVNLGVAVSLRTGGVIAPAILGADELTLAELMQALHEVTARARRGVLRGSDLAGATLTVTSLGEQGADLVHGVIFPPQVALVGFGRIVQRPWAVDGMVGARPAITATLAGDHRVSEGHRGSLYLASLDHHLQEPDQL